MAVTETGTPSGDFKASGTNWTSTTFTHTVPVDADLLLVTVSVLGGDDFVTGMIWDAAGANEALTEVHSTTGHSTDSHILTITYGLVNPTAGTSKLVTMNASAAVFTSTAGASNWKGNDTASVAAATNFVTQTVNLADVATLVLASGGSSSNLLYAAGGFRHRNSDPVSLDGTWTEVLEESSATAPAEVVLKVAKGAIGQGLTMTHSASPDQNAGHIIEMVVAAAAGGAPLFVHHINQMAGN